MSQSSFCTINLLKTSDARKVADLLGSSSESYAQFFHPFSFDEASVVEVLRQAGRDRFFGLFVTDNSHDQLVGFYMLRGFDEGYAIPMYGVFISERYSGLGLARLSLQHAETFCRLNKIAELKLKVHPNNVRARALYEELGFDTVGTDQANANLVLRKRLEASSASGDIQQSTIFFEPGEAEL
jgi:GNAT superfamily N-acetyltransferase